MPFSIVCTNAIEAESSWERPEMKIGQSENNEPWNRHWHLSKTLLNANPQQQASEGGADL